jgi:predicted DsbA family dithiol-disulfide isomerase
MEPAWQKLITSFKDRLTWRYCMGGLLRDWKSYHDTQQHVSRPIQMGPVWLEAKYTSGQPFDEKIWFADPPSSSYPACLAVKCAALQSTEAEHQYLHLLRKGVMAEGRNIARKDVLIALAAEIPGLLDIKRFEKDLAGDKALEALRADLQEVSYRDIQRFPTLVFRKEDGEGLVVTGFRPYATMLRLFGQLEEGAELPT